MYRDLIREAIDCSDAEAAQVEDIMRNVIFKSTLDWQTRKEFIDAAVLAKEILRYGANRRLV